MKTLFTIIIATIISLTIWAESTNYTSTPYLLCESIDTTTVMLNDVKEKTLITEKDLKQIEFNTKTETSNKKDPTESPNFLKLFFNFI